MNLRDSLTLKFFPDAYARRQVGAMLRELHERNKVGDEAVFDKLDELNKTTDALDVANLTACYRDGQKKGVLGAEKNSVRDGIARRQTGFALQLARGAFGDGEVNQQQKLAIADIAHQHYTTYGACGNLPRLAYSEALDLQSFANAPSQTIRVWMMEQGQKEKVDMPAVRQLAGILFADGNLTPQEKAFAGHITRVFGAPVASEAQIFLRGLGTTDLTAGDEKTSTLLDEARSKDYSVEPVSFRHVNALSEAVAYTLAHTKAVLALPAPGQ